MYWVRPAAPGPCGLGAGACVGYRRGADPWKTTGCALRRCVEHDSKVGARKVRETDPSPPEANRDPEDVDDGPAAGRPGPRGRCRGGRSQA